MTYKIEDIDWGKMPNGAAEFSLEDEEYLFTWYDGNNRFMVDVSTGWVDDDIYSDGRERHKVSDYYPSPTNLTMSDADKVEHFLKELSELSNKYKIEIGGCGCCGSPRLHPEDFVEGGCYTVDKANNFLEYEYGCESIQQNV